jgi:thermitase
MQRSILFPPLSNSISQSFRSRWQRRLFWSLLLCIALGVGSPIGVSAASCENLVVDSSLEKGSAWFIKSSGNFSLLSNYLTHTGKQAAYLAGANGANDLLATHVKLPANQLSITITFWWQIQSQESGKYNDTLAVILTDAQGKTLQNLANFSSRDMSNQWQQRTLNITSFAGQTVQLQFAARTDSEAATDFFIDDVEIVACSK